MTTINREQRRHPAKKSLSAARAEDKDAIKARKGLIGKRQTLVGTVKAADDGEVAGPSVFSPSAEQLTQINKFTRRPVAADEVACFSTLSMNDMEDRDDEKFTTQCVKDFAALPGDRSPVGKSFMMDHGRSVAQAVGRIFEVDTKSVDGSLFLTNSVYIPNTERYAGFLEDQEFGINWAVSVGVVIGRDECAVCEAPFASGFFGGYWCENGHDKGLYYDPKSTEEDAYGWPLPVDPSEGNAVKCVRLYSEPKDFYELSQVFLGAQYGAALESKDPELAAAFKSAKIIGLSADEARDLPLPKEPKRLVEARAAGCEVKTLDDGNLRWTDDDGLVWVFDPEDPESGVMSIGRDVDDPDETTEEVENGEADEEVQQPLAEHDEGDGVQGVESGEPEVGSGDAPSGEVLGNEGDQASVAAVVDGEKAIKAALLSALKGADLPERISERVERTAGSGVDALLLAVNEHVAEIRKEADALKSKAALGDRLLKERRADAIHWFAISRGSRQGGPVKTVEFEKILDALGDNLELLDAQIADAKRLADEKYPAPVRRSSFPTDPHLGTDSENAPPVSSDNDQRVRSLHH